MAGRIDIELHEADVKTEAEQLKREADEVADVERQAREDDKKAGLDTAVEHAASESPLRDDVEDERGPHSVAGTAESDGGKPDDRVQPACRAEFDLLSAEQHHLESTNDAYNRPSVGPKLWPSGFLWRGVGPRGTVDALLWKDGNEESDLDLAEIHREPAPPPRPCASPLIPSFPLAFPVSSPSRRKVRMPFLHIFGCKDLIG